MAEGEWGLLDGRDFFKEDMEGDEMDLSFVIGEGVVDLPNDIMMSIDDLVSELIRSRRSRKRNSPSQRVDFKRVPSQYGPLSVYGHSRPQGEISLPLRR